MLAYDFAFADRFNSNVGFQRFFQNLAECFRRPTRRIFFHLVMRLNDFRLEFGAEDLSGAASEGEQSVNPDAEVRSENNWQRLRGIFNDLALLRRMSGRADDERFPMLQRCAADFIDRTRVAKIDRDIAILENLPDRVADVALRDDV